MRAHRSSKARHLFRLAKRLSLSALSAGLVSGCTVPPGPIGYPVGYRRLGLYPQFAYHGRTRILVNPQPLYLGPTGYPPLAYGPAPQAPYGFRQYPETVPQAAPQVSSSAAASDRDSDFPTSMRNRPDTGQFNDSTGRTLRLVADTRHQFHAAGTVNGKSFRFLIDTGAASNVIPTTDVEQLGLAVDDLEFSGSASTANGEARIAPIRIERLNVGPFALTDQPVVVMDNVDEAILGMSFLRQFQFSVRNDVMTISESAQLPRQRPN